MDILFSQDQTTGSSIAMFLPMIMIFAVFYFLIWRPQAKERENHKNMLKFIILWQHENWGIPWKLQNFMKILETEEITYLQCELIDFPKEKHGFRSDPGYAKITKLQIIKIR